MDSFLRPEARATLWRWREVLVGSLIAALGLWWAVNSFGPVRWIAALVILGGLLSVVGAVQRLRFNTGGGGAGVVQVDERRLAYFGPLTGGVVDLGDLVL